MNRSPSSSSSTQPVTIVGGGLAGLSLGIGLRKQGVPVTLHEADHYPRHRVCGEFISGVREQTLDSLGITEFLNDASPATSTEWYRGEKSFYRHALPESARGISRYLLDQRLAEHFICIGGDLKCGSRFRRSKAGTENLAGHVVATGRKPKAGSDWLGLKMHVRHFALDADLEMHLGDNGYIGLSRVENDTVNACGLFRQKRSQRGEKAPRDTLPLINMLQGCGLEALAERILSGEVVDGSCLGVSAFQLGFQDILTPAAANDSSGSALSGDTAGPLLIGDQFAITGPFTGNGMSMAFESAGIALPLVVEYHSGAMSWSECLQQTEKALKATFKNRIGLSNRLHPFLTAGGGQTALVALSKTGLLPFDTLFRKLR